jgi:hypothetical protein
MAPEVGEKIVNFPKLFGQVTPAVLSTFFSYVLGACMLTIVSAFMEIGVGLYLRTDAGVYSAVRGSPNLLSWRKLATEFIGARFAPPFTVGQRKIMKKETLNSKPLRFFGQVFGAGSPQ